MCVYLDGGTVVVRFFWLRLCCCCNDYCCSVPLAFPIAVGLFFGRVIDVCPFRVVPVPLRCCYYGVIQVGYVRLGFDWII